MKIIVELTETAQGHVQYEIKTEGHEKASDREKVAGYVWLECINAIAPEVGNAMGALATVNLGTKRSAENS